jgi:hydroxymethylpyrimidine/phosphomethylpyrimidine kinase
MTTSIKKAIAIAGSDCSGGAGIQADLKTFQSLGVYGMSVVTAVTVQNTQKVYAIQEMTPQIVHDQITCLFEDMTVDAVKIGMVSSIDLIHAVADALASVQLPTVVLDPVMISKSGYALLQEDARKTLVEKLFPMAHVVTPNIHEAEVLVGYAIGDQQKMETAAKQMVDMGAAKVVVKGGHMAEKAATDILYDGQSFRRLSSPRLATTNTHGTGCTFSSAITALLAKGYPFVDAVQKAKTYITGAIENALDIGRGYGPTHHFFDLYAKAGMD